MSLAAAGVAAEGGYLLNSQLNNLWGYFQKQKEYELLSQMITAQATTKVDETKLDTEALKYKYYTNALAQQAGYDASKYNTFSQIQGLNNITRINANNQMFLTKMKYQHLGNMAVVQGKPITKCPRQITQLQNQRPDITQPKTSTALICSRQDCQKIRGHTKRANL